MTRYRVLVGAIVIQMILGTVYGYSIFWQPLLGEVFIPVVTEARAAELEAAGTSLASYEVVADAEAQRVVVERQRGYLKQAFALCILSFALVMVVAGAVQDRIGPRITALIGAGLMGTGFVLAGLLQYPVVFLLAHAVLVGIVALVLMLALHALLAPWCGPADGGLTRLVPLAVAASAAVAGVLLGQQYVGQSGQIDRLLLLWGTIGVLAGAGIGFAYVCPIAALIKWFPNQKGLMAGVAVAGFGFGAFLFKGQTIGALGFIESFGIRSFFIVHGLVCLVGVGVGAAMLSNPPESQDAGTDAPRMDSQDSDWRVTIRQPGFYVLWLMFFAGSLAGLMVIGIVKDFAGEQLVAAAGGEAALAADRRDALLIKGAEAIGWLAIFNAVGRVVWGAVSDRVGRTGSFIAVFLLQAGVLFGLAFMKTNVSLAVAASLIGFNYGGCFALFPSATADMFGAKNLGANYGWVFTSYGIAGVVGVAAGNAAKTLTGSYAAAFNAAAVLCLIAAALAVVLARLPKSPPDPAST
ncbi:MAG: MFS transporter [Planctomycetota bacterium]